MYVLTSYAIAGANSYRMHGVFRYAMSHGHFRLFPFARRPDKQLRTRCGCIPATTMTYDRHQSKDVHRWWGCRVLDRTTPGTPNALLIAVQTGVSHSVQYLRADRVFPNRQAVKIEKRNGSLPPFRSPHVYVTFKG